MLHARRNMSKSWSIFAGNDPRHGGRKRCQEKNARMTDKRISTQFMPIKAALMVDPGRRNWAKPYQKFIALESVGLFTVA